ncbi:RNA methyltransferase [Cellulophaga baltica]|uniref:TrmH family RNA methyltransferase n=1 Tax=Cellulophaga TaxID=104264 RepID=UPI001C06F110|nr:MULTISPECIES: RNA methyltransferase [Cellulophaga]MBU2995046.1 RNA methyltransferase [Cellulophaga baltica]MDO6766441.1 RNA methyltransferase [Cellulophaga sp. 1_MG-2023]
MVGKSQIKLIKSLQQKKIRTQQQLFVVEGKKTTQELLNSHLEVYGLYSTDQNFVTENSANCTFVSSADLKKMSSLATPNGYLGVFKMPEAKEAVLDDWIVALDFIQDPGNLGTIIRLCDWFGIKNIICTKNTVDCYNPKVLQATMGSITRVNLVYADLVEFLTHTTLPIYGAFMDGASVYKSELPKKGIIVMGNEANGVSSLVLDTINEKISIPQYGEKTTESLNVATATAILLNEIRRA